jgi:hypothetical protein
VLAKERRNVEIKIIITHNLGDVVKPIIEQENLMMGYDKGLFLQMQPNFVTHLKRMWHLVLIMTLLVIVIGILQDILNLLEDVLDLLNGPGGFANFSWKGMIRPR